MRAGEPGAGSTFRIFLPEIQTEPKEEPLSEPGSMPEGRERILFVDDEKAIVDIGRQTMEHLGYRVTGLTSALDPARPSGST